MLISLNVENAGAILAEIGRIYPESNKTILSNALAKGLGFCDWSNMLDQVGNGTMSAFGDSKSTWLPVKKQHAAVVDDQAFLHALGHLDASGQVAWDGVSRMTSEDNPVLQAVLRCGYTLTP